jgi:hypothetical protein
LFLDFFKQWFLVSRCRLQSGFLLLWLKAVDKVGVANEGFAKEIHNEDALWPLTDIFFIETRDELMLKVKGLFYTKLLEIST